MTHIEDLVHLFPVCSALLLNKPEQRRCLKEVILDNVEVIDEVKYFGLRAATAMYHAVDNIPEILEYLDKNWGVGTGRGEYQLADIYVKAGYAVCHIVRSGVNEFRGD